MNILIIAQRHYGEPKLKMPKELKGVSKIGTVPFGHKCKCPVYIHNKQIYLKHRDFFSPSISIPQAQETGIISQRDKKFIYNDNFGSVVLRCEAWLRIPLLLLTKWKGLLPTYGLCTEMARTVALPEDALFNHDWTQMFEELLKLAKPYLPKRPNPTTYSSLRISTSDIQSRNS